MTARDGGSFFNGILNHYFTWLSRLVCKGQRSITVHLFLPPEATLFQGEPNVSTASRCQIWIANQILIFLSVDFKCSPTDVHKIHFLFFPQHLPVDEKRPIFPKRKTATKGHSGEKQCLFSWTGTDGLFILCSNEVICHKSSLFQCEISCTS